MTDKISRRSFLGASALAAGSVSIISRLGAEEKPKIAGFDQTATDVDATKVWTPKSDRKIKMGIVGFGVCQFGPQFGLQNHPNVEVVAVSDLFEDRCANLAKACRCEKTYKSLEEMLEKDKEIEAVFCATDAPSHADHCIKVLNSGRHVATAVPAVFGNLEDADRVFEAVKKSGLTYMMFETSTFHDDVFATRTIHQAGLMGRMLYTEGEYYHFGCDTIDSYKGWRIGLPPQWYPTHSNAYYTCATLGSFTEVSCFGARNAADAFGVRIDAYKPENNVYKNPFGTEIALFRTSEGGMARMGVSWDTPGWGGETGRNRGEFGSYWNNFETQLPEVREKVAAMGLKKPALPPGVEAGGHGGSHGYLGNEFVESILEGRKPLVNVAVALNTTVAGIVAHQSALKDGELMKIPQYEYPFEK